MIADPVYDAHLTHPALRNRIKRVKPFKIELMDAVKSMCFSMIAKAIKEFE